MDILEIKKAIHVTMKGGGEGGESAVNGAYIVLVKN